MKFETLNPSDAPELIKELPPAILSFSTLQIFWAIKACAEVVTLLNSGTCLLSSFSLHCAIAA